MWEVDPETRSKLLEIQKKDGNNICCDCGAPAPQWASPKFGIFICLTCAGLHRGLGVHISFVRSITMDAFKTHEISRMDKGGNKAWKAFFEQHQLTKLSGVGWDQSTVADRYGGEVGDEWKDRLTARVEGRDYVPGEKKEKKSATDGAAASRSATPSRNLAGPGSSAPRDRSPSAASLSGGVGSRKEKNEAYFAKMGAENANRPEDLPPSQGGKYAGFGSAPAPGPEPRTANGALPGLDDLQKDPVAAVSKGFGWFAAAVGKSAKTVNDGFIQPTAQKLAEADLASTARTHAAALGQNLQAGTKGAAETFNRFVEGEGAGGSGGRPVAPLDESKKDFWDSFGGGGGSAAGAAESSKPSAIGTAAMRKGGGPGPGTKEEGWEDGKWEKF